MLDSILAAIGIDPLTDGVLILPASALAPPPAAPDAKTWSSVAGGGVPYLPPLVPSPLVPSRPLLLTGLAGQSGETGLGAVRGRYPASHSARIVRQAVDGSIAAEPAAVGDLAALPADCIAIFVPPLDPLLDRRAEAGPAYVVSRLLGPGGCPWDMEQTPQSLRSALLEECYEVIEALDSGDRAALSEELGDLLLAVLVHSEMARLAGHFSIEDVYEELASKLIGRHPHVFGARAVSGVGEVLTNWETIKREEHAVKGKPARGALDGIPPALPALAFAQKLTRKAAKAGFDAPDAAYAWALLEEELDELRAAAGDATAIDTELGDALLALATLARKLDADAETVLREAAARFSARFARMEHLAGDDDLRALDDSAKLALWERAREPAGK